MIVAENMKNMPQLAVDYGPQPFKTLMTIRLTHRVITVEDDAKHWEQYRALITFLRDMRKEGWKIESVETIDADVCETEQQ